MDDKLELKMLANLTDVSKMLDTVNNKLGNTGKEVNKVTVALDKMGNVKKTTVAIKSISDEAKKANKSIGTAFNAGKLYAFWNYSKRIRDSIYGWVTSSMDFIETTNKFEVSMGRMTNKAVEFQDKIANAFGTARTEMMEFQANFNSIMKSLPGLAEETSYAISETLVQMGIDYSSLFNVSTGSAMEKIQAALVGNVKSIRSTSGYDITEATIADLAKSLGVEKSVRQMNQMEKRLLRIIALMNQMKATGAMGDLARTIEQPANQMKVLKNQLQELGVWLGNVFIGTIGKILPYINGFVMALKEIIKMLAIFVGYKATDNIADPIQTAETASSGIADNLGSATKSAKELRKTLMGFDVLNVIQTPTASAGGGGAGVDTIDPAILNALEEYDSLMDGVRMKAMDIRDRIMEWLGFTKDVNGEWKFSGEKLLKNIWNWWSKLNGLGKIFVALGIASVLALIWNFIKKFVSATGLPTIYNWIKKLLSPSTKLFDDIKLAIKTKPKYESFLTSVWQGYSKWYKELKPIPALLSGVLEIIGGFTLFSQGLKDFSENGNKVFGTIELIGGSLLTLIGTFTIVTAAVKIFGATMSTQLALATAGISVVLTAIALSIKAIYDAVTSKSELEEYTDSLNELKDAAKDTAIETIALGDATYKLSKELENYIDASGKVKDADKERVEYILDKLNDAYGTEYKLVGNVITKNGEVVKSYKDIQNEIDKLMSKYRAKAVLEAKHDTYVKALKDNYEVNQKLNKLQNELNNGKQYYYDLASQGKMTEEEAQQAFIENYKTRIQKYNDLSDRRNLNAKEIKSYSDLEYAITSEQYDKMDELTKGYFDNVEEYADNSATHFDATISGAVKDVTDKVFEAKTSIERNPATFTVKTAVQGAADAAKTAAKTFGDNFRTNLNLGKIRIQDVANKNYVGNGFNLVTLRASGGFPSIGEMFIAREAGPELVGNIGSKNAVMNNQQIVAAVSQGVAQAVASVLPRTGGDYNFYLDGKQLTATVKERLQREANISGVGVY